MPAPDVPAHQCMDGAGTEFGDLNTPMTAQVQWSGTASPFQVSGATLKRGSLILGLGDSSSIRKCIDLFAETQAEQNSAQRRPC